VVNTDCDLRSGWLEALQSGLEDPQVGIVGYPEQPEAGEEWRRALYQEVHQPEYVTGHCLLLRMEMLEEIGVFCETDTTGRDIPELAHCHGQAHIGSDKMLSWRANAAGWKTLYCRYPGVYHEAGKSWGHRLDWLSEFRLESLWPACDTLEETWLPSDTGA
jgi:GT2 family glycosyltransferase